MKLLQDSIMCAKEEVGNRHTQISLRPPPPGSTRSRVKPFPQGPPGKIRHRLFLIQGGLFQPLVQRSGQIDCEPDTGLPIGSSWSRGRGRRWGRGLGGRRCRGIPPHESGGIGGQQGLTGGHGSGVQ